MCKFFEYLTSGDKPLVIRDIEDSFSKKENLHYGRGITLLFIDGEFGSFIFNGEVYRNSLYKSLGYIEVFSERDYSLLLTVLHRTWDKLCEDNYTSDGYMHEGELIPWKAFFKATGLNKIERFSVIAERLKSKFNQRVAFFTDYTDILKYYTDSKTSGGSCMRFEFSSLPVHPCAVYAQSGLPEDLDYEECVSPEIKLAVLFKGDEPCARVLVYDDGTTKGRAKAQGDCASELTKALESMAWSDITEMPEYHVNIIRDGNGGYIMPYIDTHGFVDTDDGRVNDDCQGVTCKNTSGVTTQGEWSEWENAYIPEDEAVYSAYLDDWIHSESAITVVYRGAETTNHADNMDDFVYCTDSERWVYTDEAHYSENFDEWYEDVDELQGMLESAAQEKLNNMSISELEEFLA
jgi:hypothetical protein